MPPARRTAFKLASRLVTEKVPVIIRAIVRGELPGRRAAGDGRSGSVLHVGFRAGPPRTASFPLPSGYSRHWTVPAWV